MAGKSLDEIWRQMQAQRQAEIARQQSQERALNEQRERARQEYLSRMRMYEKIGTSIPSSAASAGSGGRRNIPNVSVSTSNQASLYWIWDSGILYYFIFNFGTNFLSDIKQVTIGYVNEYPVTEGGFLLKSNDDDNLKVDLLFIDLNGNIIWQDKTDNQSDFDIENFSRYVGVYYLKSNNWKIVLFDSNSNIKEFSFGENRIEGGGYSYNDIWSGGLVVVEEIGTIRRYYIINFNEGTKVQFYEVDNDLGDYLNVYQYSYSNKILTRKNGTIWEVFSHTGDKIAEFDPISQFETSNWYDNSFTFLDDNGSFLIIGNINDSNNKTITFFSGSENNFSHKLVDSSVYGNYVYDIYNQKDYDSTTNWNAGGSAILLFYDSSTNSGDLTYYSQVGLSPSSPEAIILPIWSSDSELRDFYTLPSTMGINDNLDDSDISFSRSSNHICLLIGIESEENYSILRFNREGDSTTLIQTDINKSSELDDDDQINGKTILQFERGFTASDIYAESWGWGDLSDVEDRFYYSFAQANNNEISSYVEGQEFIMKDVTNGRYWGIKFTDWGDYWGDGSFAYTRQLISDGTFSGEPILFTFSNFEQVESDIISEGVLELRRGLDGSIYNSAKEGESNGYNPSGTLWNSLWVYNLNTYYEYKWFVSPLDISPTNSTDFNMIFNAVPDGTGIEYNTDIDWTNFYDKPYYLPDEGFAWQVDCLLRVDIPGTYSFRITSYDGNQLSINGNVVAEFYGNRTIGDYDTSSPIDLSSGLHTLRYRMQNQLRYGDFGSGASVQWQGPGDGTFSVIPSQNLLINNPIVEYDHYIIRNDGEVIGSVSTGNQYNNDYEGSTYILEDQIFNNSWISNNEESLKWLLLDKYYEECEDVNNIITENGIRKGIFLLQSGFDYMIVTEDSHIATFSVPFTGYLNKIETDDVFHKGAFVLSYDDSSKWLRFYNINGNLIETIESDFDGFDYSLYGDRCFVQWSEGGTRRFAFFNGDIVTQFDSGRSDWNYSINDYNWWD